MQCGGSYDLLNSNKEFKQDAHMRFCKWSCKPRLDHQDIIAHAPGPAEGKVENHLGGNLKYQVEYQDIVFIILCQQAAGVSQVTDLNKAGSVQPQCVMTAGL